MEGKSYNSEQVSRIVNYASDLAHNLIFEFAGRFEKRQQYMPIEKLAQNVQGEIVKDCVALPK